MYSALKGHIWEKKEINIAEYVCDCFCGDIDIYQYNVKIFIYRSLTHARMVCSGVWYINQYSEVSKTGTYLHVTLALQQQQQ